MCMNISELLRTLPKGFLLGCDRQEICTAFVNFNTSGPLIFHLMLDFADKCHLGQRSGSFITCIHEWLEMHSFLVYVFNLVGLQVFYKDKVYLINVFQLSNNLSQNFSTINKATDKLYFMSSARVDVQQMQCNGINVAL